MVDLRPSLAALSRVSYIRQLNGDLDGAMTAMGQALSASAGVGYDTARIATLLGELHLLRGEIDAAGRSFDAALELSPDMASTALGKAKVQEATGQRDLAILTLKSAVDRFPDPAAARFLGELQALDGQNADARTSFQLVQAIHKLQASAGAVIDLEVALFEADHG